MTVHTNTSIDFRNKSVTFWIIRKDSPDVCVVLDLALFAQAILSGYDLEAFVLKEAQPWLEQADAG